VDGSAVPSLAGMPREYLSSQMRAFKNGTRPATIMHQLAKGYSDAQIEQIAAYFAAQKK
jgi:cytochrome subunit of sulfide dehydrogenase